MPTDVAASVRHEPLLYSTSRYGSWGECLCGEWRSGTWSSVIGVHVEFGSHLLAEHHRARLGEQERR